ncbi:ATP-dependent helicase [Psychrobacillus psychrodurans]|uniref:ATP-dependent helicase n=1 Tax=Psychrobacillus psychrodurans TaxID=126157 RepID=UPI001F4ECB04|nr:ATP-dependent helicase [Psychrobacillus psychrodurans]MCK1997512.1 ATP-dependent helicase [Psychrobacillus psychrodurans]
MFSSEDFFNNKKRELGVSLNKVQKEAVLNNHGQLLLLASPGSGKTTTIIMKIGYLIEVMGVDPSRIKAVTFSKASANDMKERFKRFFPKLPTVDFSTIHSLAFQIVREYFYHNRIDYQLIEGKVNSETQKNGYIGQELNKKKILRQIYKSENNEAITEDVLEELITYITYIKNKLLPEEHWNITSCKISNKEIIAKHYEYYKKNGADKLLLDYDDMLTIANEVLENEKTLLTIYQEKFDFVLTDESQDTSLVQHSIIEKLVQKHKNLCVVADEDQSIYSWRGAEPKYLLNFNKVYPEAKILMMLQNYRSSKDIVDVANTFIKQNKERYEKNMFTENPVYKPIKLKTLSNYNLQPQYLVDQILKIEKYQDVAVLYRNNISSILLMDSFDRSNIPFYMKDSDNLFFNHWVVEDILNFMRLSFDLKRTDVFERIYSKFNGYITKAQIEELKKVNNNHSVFDNLLTLNNLKEYQKSIIKKFKDSYTKINNASPKSVIQIIRNDLGLERVLKDRSKKNGYNFENIIDILNTLEMISNSTNTLVEFANRLKHLETKMKASKFNKDKNAVIFSTFHSSKGLEFKTVYMIDLINGIIPSKSNQEESGESQNIIEEKEIVDLEEEKEEEVRLFYVGMTRAKYNLELITYTKKFNKAVEQSEFLEQVNKVVNPFDNTIPKTILIPTTINKGLNKDLKTKIPTNPNAIKNKAVLNVGIKVKHRVFGTGEIIACTDEVLEIRFLKYSKKLQISTCLELGLIELAY